ncbi:RepB family plasmid replication initiator protein (plasmid) [Klebsiella pneumoniae]|uniref:RepB family plasmid replication initiator protein n=1 Tax=Klebsiella pneumoniae TaxID=573 RepID=UPI0037453914
MDKLLNKKIKVKQSNELTEAAYYLSLKAKRVLWLCLMQTYFTASVSEDDDEMAVLGDSTFKVKVADYEQIFRHCCKVSDEAAFCLIQRPYISKTLLTRRISPRGSP